MIVTYCNRYRINDQINALWDQLNMPVNDNLQNGLVLLEQIREVRRRLLL